MSRLSSRTTDAFIRWVGQPAFHFVLLAALTGWQLVISWRRWPDPVVDFGRELYIPWRLAEGAVLYRDVEDFYGPLSQYLNALLFRVFGPGMMTLVAANLAVFAGIVTTAYFLVRRAWGAGAALASTAVLVAVFGFSRIVYVGNFNYATPYAHETTHGMLVLLLLAAALSAWLQRPTLRLNAVVGLLFGLTLVLKPEIILSGALLVAVAVGLGLARGGRWSLGKFALAAGIAALPTVLFTAYFMGHMSFAEAWSAAGRAWWNVVVTTRFIAEPAQLSYSGLDAPWPHLGEHVLASLGALGIVAVLGVAAWLFEKRGATKGAWLGAAGVVILIAAGASVWPQARWLDVGRCLLGLVVVYWFFCAGRFMHDRREKKENAPAVEIRILLAVLGASLMARMVLAGRIYQFGYYQAAIAAVVVVAVLIGEMPGRLAVTRAGRLFVVACMLGLLVPGVLAISAKSRATHELVDSPMGRSADQFYTFKPSVPLASLATVLEKQPRGSTLMVLPEGLMLNYLVRMPSPVPHFFFYSAVTERGNEARLVTKLNATPPDFVVILPRDLREYGIAQYGERSGAGGDILAWMQGRYELFGWLREGAPEAEPPVNLVAYRDRYFQIYRRKR